MKRFAILGIVALLGFSLLGGTLAGAEPTPGKQGENAPKVELTDAQKQELDTLYKQLLETRKALLNKYVEYGVLTKEKADKKISWLEDHYKKIKEHNYVPMWDHHKKKMHNDDKNDE